MLRRLTSWLRFQDLDARRDRALGANKDLLKRIEDLEARHGRLVDEGTAIAARSEELDRRTEEAQRTLAAYDAATIKFDVGPVPNLKAAAEDLQRSTRDFGGEADAIEAEITRIAEDQKSVSTEMDAVEATRQRRMSRVYAVTLAAQLITIAALLIPGGYAKLGHSIHLDYYSAVASLAPILLIAGLAELVLLGPRIAVAMLTFAVPAIGAEAASLVVLASHVSGSATFLLTLWGIGGTLLSLLNFFVVHLKFPPTSS